MAKNILLQKNKGKGGSCAILQDKEVLLPSWMIHQSFRYCLGRATYAVNGFCDWCVQNWDRVPELEKRIIKRELEDTFTRGTGLGMNCDRREWERVRALWRDE